ncbi:MAG TPA: nicotinate-nucleotide adenylyltransferase [candidate division Zixibacteria bacterium]|nr:nicotinate-nucleotide adenylyltransferase [candidate division Zixibacteria bacterium]
MPGPDNGGNWGILGGSFDPVHNGHLNLAESVLKIKNLDGVLFIPAYRHPLKKPAASAPYDSRVDMLKLALSGRKNLILSEIERSEKLTGYTFDLLPALKKGFPKAKFHFIIGSDLVSQLPNWHRAKDLLKECSFLVGARPGTKLRDIKKPAGAIMELVEIEELDISASDIRERIKNGADKKDLSQWVPAKVAEYICEKGLYN